MKKLFISKENDLITVRMVIIKSIQIINAGEGVEKRKLSQNIN